MNEVVSVWTGLAQRYVLGEYGEALQPALEICFLDEEKKEQTYTIDLPQNAILLAENGQEVCGGELLARLPIRSVASELQLSGGFEQFFRFLTVATPKEPAILAKKSGVVENLHYDREKEVQEITLISGKGEESIHKMPLYAEPTVIPGEWVKIGEPLCAGERDLQELLILWGPSYLARHMIRELHTLYLLQDVFILEKHLMLLVLEMLGYVKSEEQTEEMHIREFQRRLLGEREGKEIPLLLGLHELIRYKENSSSPKSGGE